VDRNGVTRPQGNGYDIGAHEYTPNVPPTALADAYTTSQDTPLEIPALGVLGNDEDAEKDLLAAVLVDAPANGALGLNANGSFIYTPAAGFSGSDSFTYRADDYADQSAPATVTINVLLAGDNVPPVAVSDAYTARQDTALEIPAPGVLDNDLDVDGDTLAAVVESQPAHGALTLKANGSFTYTPAAGYTGNDSFSYRANDGKASSAAVQVTLTVLPAGANLPPIAFGDQYEVARGATLTISAPGVLDNDQDGDGNGLAAVVESQPAHGALALGSDGAFTYTPAIGFTGVDSFTYRVTDSTDQSGPATVTITVRPSGVPFHRLLLPVVEKP
jgi:VCBS repeat-containing protein